MAKKNKKNSLQESDLYNEIYDKNIIEEDMSEFCTEMMKVFGANNNILRHTPFLIDGLKPGARRLLVTMWSIFRARHTDQPKKVNTIAGATMQLHPHGDTSIYDVLVKLGQTWSNLVCPIQAKGNFGSASGESAAAGRYIEAKLSYFAYKCFFEDYDESVCNMMPSYTGEFTEPEFLPARYPNILINSYNGIGYAVRVGIPSFNFKEVCELTIKLIKDPGTKDVYLIPDLPSGSLVIDDGQFQEICRTGKGKYRTRAEIEIKDNELIIKSIPPTADLITIKQVILDKINPPGLTNIKDFSKGPDIDMHLIFKKEIDLVAIEQMLYKTRLQITEPVSFSVVDDYDFVDTNLKKIILDWVDYRREMKRKIYNKKYVKAGERIHILDTMIFILSEHNLEKTTTIIKKSMNKKDIIHRLMKEYGISSLQADQISEMKLSAFTIEARKKYESELNNLKKDIEIYKGIMLSRNKIDDIIIEELEEGIKLFGEPRRSKIITVNDEDSVSRTNHVIVVTKEGMIKKLGENVKEVGNVNQGDYPIEILQINNIDDLLVFDSKGKIYKIPVSNIPICTLDSIGHKITKYAAINGQVQSIIAKPRKASLKAVKEKTNQDVYFVFVTKNGLVKKTSVDKYINMANELIGINIKEDDELVSVLTVLGDKDIVIYTDCGLGARFSTRQIRETSRTAIGVKGMDLVNNENVVAASLINEKDKYLFILTNKGNAKKCLLSEFVTMDRNSKPLKLMNVDTDNSEKLKFVEGVKGNETFRMFMKGEVQEINIEEVPKLPRLGKGKKMVPVRRGETIIDIKEVK